jgi:hypothetical protein
MRGEETAYGAATDDANLKQFEAPVKSEVRSQIEEVNPMLGGVYFFNLTFYF